MEQVLAVDIGGTTIRVSLADSSGLKGDVREYQTDSISSAEEFGNHIVKDVNDVDAIGIAAAGVVDRNTNELLNVANWSGWDLIPLEERFGAPLALENDADASALGIKKFGQEHDYTNFAYLTLSTGIGSGIIQDNALVPSVEAGFININWDGDVKHADVNNPWEAYASGTGFPSRMQEWLSAEQRSTVLTGDETNKEFFDAVYEGDAVARDYYTTLKKINAAGIGTLKNLFGLGLVKIGGGVAKAHPKLIDYESDPNTTEEIDLAKYCLGDSPKISAVDTDSDLELYGAAAAALNIVEGN